MHSTHEHLKSRLRSFSDSRVFTAPKRSNIEENSATSEEETVVAPPRNVRNRENNGCFSRRNLFIFMYIICLIGCIYQMIEVCFLYFDYESVSTVTIDKATRVIPPSMSICFPFTTLIKLPVLFQMFPKCGLKAEEILNKTGETIDFKTHRIRYFKRIENSFDAEFGKYIETHLKIDEILAATITLEEMFVQCVLMSPETYIPVDTKSLNDCKKIWDIDYYLKDENKCFLFAFRTIDREYIYNLFHLSNNFAYRNLLEQIRFDWKNGLTEQMERANVIFHPRDRLPRGRLDPVLVIRAPAKDVSYTITYSKSVSVLLPLPYESDCKNYTEIGFESQADCVDKCVIRESMTFFNRVPSNLLHTKDSRFKLIFGQHVDGNNSITDKLDLIATGCRQLCHNHDCYNEYYTPKLVATEDGTNLKFIIEVPSSLDIQNELSVKMTFIEYIVKNTSVFNFWFGLCILQFADAIEYFKKKRSQAGQLRRSFTRSMSSRT